MSRHATFENFGMAFLTLFQVSTGDNWNGIMKVHVVGRGGRVRLDSACPVACCTRRVCRAQRRVGTTHGPGAQQGGREARMGFLSALNAALGSDLRI